MTKKQEQICLDFKTQLDRLIGFYNSYSKLAVLFMKKTERLQFIRFYMQLVQNYMELSAFQDGFEDGFDKVGTKNPTNFQNLVSSIEELVKKVLGFYRIVLLHCLSIKKGFVKLSDEEKLMIVFGDEIKLIDEYNGFEDLVWEIRHNDIYLRHILENDLLDCLKSWQKWEEACVYENHTYTSRKSPYWKLTMANEELREVGEYDCIPTSVLLCIIHEKGLQGKILPGGDISRYFEDISLSSETLEAINARRSKTRRLE